MERGTRTTHHTRRGFLKSVLAASASAWIVPAHVLGSAAQTPPSGNLTLGVIGVGAKGTKISGPVRQTKGTEIGGPAHGARTPRSAADSYGCER
jgi:hypothetical protein